MLERPVRLGHVGFGAIAAFQALQAGEAAGDAEGFGERDRVVGPALRQLADAAVDVDGAGCGLALPCNEMQQRGFARAVAADEANALRPDDQVEVFEQDAITGRSGGDAIERD